MGFSDRFIRTFKSILPSPFTIALILTVLTYVLSVSLTDLPDITITPSSNNFTAGESIELTANGGRKYTWSTGEQGNSIRITPTTDTVFTLTGTALKGTFTKTESLHFTLTNNRLLVAQASVFTNDSKYLQAIRFWEKGMWENGYLAFLVQMMLMLVLGHVLALTTPVNRLIVKVAQYCRTTASAVVVVSMLTILVSFFNWGLALIFGAILARKVGEYAATHRLPIHYGLVGAAGYSGLMTWHGGLSGSALIKAADQGHIRALMSDIMSPEQLAQLPERIPMSETFGSSMNLTVMAALVAIVPLGLYLVARKSKGTLEGLPSPSGLHNKVVPETTKPTGAERLDFWKWPAYLIGGSIVVYCGFRAYESGMGVLNPNYINLSLLGLGLLMHSSIARFLSATQTAIGGSTGILIQFPLYFGIMAIMNKTGLVHVFSDFFVAHSTSTTFPVFTFISAGVVNLFVPSGGGQWGVQGPMLLQAATDLGIGYPKSILALAYGDQVTNMLQPFWALPLLGITGLKARDILPYTLFLFLVGSAIFISALLIF